MKLTGEKPVPVPLSSPQIPHGLTPGSNPGLQGVRPATNRLSHGTAFLIVHFLFRRLIVNLILRIIITQLFLIS